MSGLTLQGAINETKATVAPGHTAIDLTLANQTYVEVLHGGQRIFRLPTNAGTLSVTIPPGDYTIRTDGTATAGASRDAAAPAVAGPEVIAQPAQRAPLQLTSDATTRHEVDGIAVLPADGHSFLTLTVQRTVAGQESAIMYLRATGGRLMDDTGQHAIRSLTLQSGSGRFRLVSDPVPRVVTVTALIGRPPESATLGVEFAPA